MEENRLNKIIFTLFCTLLPLGVNALASEAKDDPMELSARKTCQFDGDLSERQVKKIMEKALNGDSVSAMFLYNNLNFVKGRDITNTSEWLSLIEHKNPIAYMYLTFNLFRSQEIKDFEKGVAKLKVSAELGFLEATYFLIEVYQGKIQGFESYANLTFAKYWREKYALAGNLFFLKEFVSDNPNKLIDEELKPWRDAYGFISSSIGGKADDFSVLSSRAQWLVRLFERNKNNLTELLKQHHEVYAVYKYCVDQPK